APAVHAAVRCPTTAARALPRPALRAPLGPARPPRRGAHGLPGHPAHHRPAGARLPRGGGRLPVQRRRGRHRRHLRLRVGGAARAPRRHAGHRRRDHAVDGGSPRRVGGARLRRDHAPRHRHRGAHGRRRRRPLPLAHPPPLLRHATPRCHGGRDRPEQPAQDRLRPAAPAALPVG
ncbi:MAG: hypothetical protein AVDCRST_MAG11-2065, partial [uncultured Gemmatimonadaceae bacterium]